MFRMGVISWHCGDFVIGSISDASHADEHCERTGEPYRSQGGRMTILATRSLVDQAECGFHLIARTSNTLKRVCRSTLTAETKYRKQRSTKGEEGAAGAATIERNTRRSIGKWRSGES